MAAAYLPALPAAKYALRDTVSMKRRAKCSRIAVSMRFLSAGCQQVIGVHTNVVSVLVI